MLERTKSKSLGQRQKRNKTSGKSIMSAIFILKRVKLPFLPSEQPDTSIYANMGMVNLARIPHQQIHLWFFYQLLVASLIVCCLKLSPCKFSRYTCYMNTYFQSCQPSLFFLPNSWPETFRAMTNKLWRIFHISRFFCMAL